MDPSADTGRETARGLDLILPGRGVVCGEGAMLMFFLLRCYLPTAI